MTRAAAELVRASHPIIAAVPCFVPTLAVVYRDRRRNPPDGDRNPTAIKPGSRSNPRADQTE
ncbi:hypothetical protein [Saccharopolyspora sp. 5N708]|uniref:hypothetical protein n=1 Tax=Saccharopolyspora sp. 5N708 TaxID=3457424 RepID=UPI003FD5B7DA